MDAGVDAILLDNMIGYGPGCGPIFFHIKPQHRENPIRCVTTFRVRLHKLGRSLFDQMRSLCPSSGRLHLRATHGLLQNAKHK